MTICWDANYSTTLKYGENWIGFLLSLLLFLLWLLLQKITVGTFSEIRGLCRFYMKSNPTNCQVRSKASPLLGNRCLSLLPWCGRGPCCCHRAQRSHGSFLQGELQPGAPLHTCLKIQKQSYVYLNMTQICYKKISISNFRKPFLNRLWVG